MHLRKPKSDHCDRPIVLLSLKSSSVIMGKLNIAHHKSYHPYRRDNIERVRRDEEEARLKEAAVEGRMLLVVRGTTYRLTSEAEIPDPPNRMQKRD